MARELYIGTGQGFFIVRKESDKWETTSGGLAETGATSILAHEGVILAGTRNGVYRSQDGGRTWTAASVGLTVPYVRWMDYHPSISDLEFAGTEPADIFVSHDGGNNWRECHEIVMLREVNKWFLPYSRGAGCIRGFAFHGTRAYAAAEVGGLLRSDNTGETWLLAEGSDGNPDLDGPPEPLIYPDVHSVAVHPLSPDLVYAPTGGGMYRSWDGGKTFRLAYDCYCRSVWVDDTDPDHLILGSAEGVSENGKIEETRDGGETWHPASDGMNVPWRDYMVERFTQIEDDLYAILSNGELLVTPLKTLQWERILTDIQGITCVTAMHG